MPHKPAVGQGFLVEPALAAFLHDVQDILNHSCSFYRIFQILVHRGVDNVQCDRPDLILGYIQSQMLFNNIRGLFRQLKFFFVKLLDLNEERIPEDHALFQYLYE